MSKEMGMFLGAILGLALCLRETFLKVAMPHPRLRKALVRLTTYTIVVMVIIIITVILGAV